MAVGGAVGSLARVAVDELTSPGGWGWGTVAVNTVGSFALAVLLLGVTSHSVAHRRLRLMLGTGLLGGFTTFSAFALHADTLARQGQPALSVGYVLLGLSSMVLGAAAGAAVGRSRAVGEGSR